MKRMHFIGLLALTAIALVGCKGNKEDSKKEAMPMPIEMGIAFLQLSHDDYYNYVLADPYYEPIDTTIDRNNYHMTCYYLRSRYDNGVCQECFLGTNPYIDLGEGWFATDWKWGSFAYPYTNVLLSVLWTDVKDSWQVWDMNTPIITKSHTIRHGGVSRRTIDYFMGITPAPIDTSTLEYHNGFGRELSPDYLQPLWLYYNWHFKTIAEIPDILFTDDSGQTYTKENYLHEIARQDSLQRVYVERLRAIIRQGKLEDLCTIHYINEQ